MSKLIASFFVSLDGVVEAPETWHFPYFDAEMGAVIGQSMTSCEAFLLGRRTYHLREIQVFVATEAVPGRFSGRGPRGRRPALHPALSASRSRR